MILIVHYSISSVEMFLNPFYDNESNYIVRVYAMGGLAYSS